MKDKDFKKSAHWLSQPGFWLLFITALALIARLYHITYPIDDAHDFRQTADAGLIRDWYRNGINFFYPSLLSLGKPGYLVQELPLYQAIAALLYKLITPDVIVARVFTIIAGLLSILFIYRISSRFLDRKSSLLASFFFAFMPLDIFFQRIPLQDPLTILFSLIMLDFLIKGTSGKKKYFIFSIPAAILGFMMKSPFVAPLFLPVFYMAWRRRKKFRDLFEPRLLLAFLIPFAAMVIWQHHANYVNETYCHKDGYPFKYLYSLWTHPLVGNKYYFGTLSQRLDPSNYLLILRRLAMYVLTPPGTVLFILGAVYLARRKKESFAFLFMWLFSLCLIVMMIFSLYIFHNYYLMLFCPVLAIFCGAGTGFLLDTFKRYGKKTFFAGTFAITVMFLLSGIYFAKDFYRRDGWVIIGQFVGDHTERDALVAVVTPSPQQLDPKILYFADRHGFVVPSDIMNSALLDYFVKQNVKYLAVAETETFDNMPGKAALDLKIFDISSGKPALNAEGWKFL